MFITKRSFALSLLMMSVAACSDKVETNTAAPKAKEEPVAAASAAPANGKTYRVVSEITFAPFIMRDDKGSISGFEYDLLQAIAAKEGFNLTFEAHPWKGIFETLSNNEADIVSAGVSSTDERKQQWGVTNAYFQSAPAILVKKDSPIQGFADLQGRTVSVKPGTLSEGIVKQHHKDKKQIMNQETSWLLVKEVIGGRADAVVDDEGPLKYYEKNYSKEGIRVIVDANVPKIDYSFVVRKTDTELLNQLNDGLAKLKQDGTYDQIYRKYF
ncbi:transporter substrate-binding domain-containing protein [Kingella negevensis]|uniref:transporter substrate-binding domain-containing protein n=1 Tax=Kingella negevensis TaxID=1522312 RepID=UPI00050A1E96|nr:transporter substrate-binding domain-containing protein [Kingella negevensis]MDK4687960.1 transporter substrate-binding domain-containing protein [Kingella negevensis]WII91053.1 transporter substrate-binding domain-containing protein [Kingella negevensis]